MSTQTQKQTQHQPTHEKQTGGKEYQQQIGSKECATHGPTGKECPQTCPSGKGKGGEQQYILPEHHEPQQGVAGQQPSSRYDINEAEQHKRIQKGETGVAAATAQSTHQQTAYFPKIHYFPINGRGDLIKVLFEDAGKPYEYVTHAVGTHRFTLTMLPFGQLPIMIEPDGYPLVQTGTIIRYVAKQQNQYPSNQHDAAHAEMVVDQCLDIMGHYFSFLHSKKTREELISYLTGQWGYMECLLNCSESKHKSPWLTSCFCFADLILWHVVHTLKVFQGDLPAKLQDHYNRVNSRRNIQEYVASNRFMPARLEPCKKLSEPETATQPRSS